jgi:peptide/nickel transport system permease protein
MAIGETETQSGALLAASGSPGPFSDPASSDALGTRQLTQAQLIWIRFRRHKLAMIGSGTLMFIIMVAIFAPLIAPENIYDEFANNIDATDWAPQCSGGFHNCFRYLFGTDYNGHSMMAQVIWGARYSLLIGISAALLTTIIGATVGSISGYFGGWVDSVIMRTVDVFLTLPFLPVLIAAAGILGGGHTSVILVIAIFTFFGWAYIARLTRGQFLSLRTLEYIEAARAVGVSTRRIIFRHMLPNALRPILVATTLGIAGNIVGEAAIDFLGFGLQYPDTSWGTVLSYAEQEEFRFWWLTVIPGLFLVITIVSVNFIGDGLSDALDVKSKA